MWTLDELVERAHVALSAEYPGAPNGRVRELPDRRAIRWYTQTGLVDRPLGMRGRTALYGPRHLLQLVALKRRQADGRTLAEIQAELAGSPDEVLSAVARVPERLLAVDGPPPDDAGPRIRFWAAGPPQTLGGTAGAAHNRKRPVPPRPATRVPTPAPDIAPVARTTPGGTARGDSTPGGNAPRDGTPSDSAPGGTAPDGTAAGGTLLGDTAPGDTAPGRTAADGTPRGGTAADGTPRGDTAPGGIATDGTAADGTPRGGTAADGTPRGDTAPGGIATDGIAADGTTADGTAPGDTAPGGIAAHGTTADGTAARGTAAVGDGGPIGGGEPVAHTVGGVALRGGAILVVPALPTASDRAAIAAAAEPLLALLDARGLLTTEPLDDGRTS